jgi:hypothetical protein
MPLATKPFGECPKCGGELSDDPVYQVDLLHYSYASREYSEQLHWLCRRCRYDASTTKCLDAKVGA